MTAVPLKFLITISVKLKAFIFVNPVDSLENRIADGYLLYLYLMVAEPRKNLRFLVGLWKSNCFN